MTQDRSASAPAGGSAPAAAAAPATGADDRAWLVETTQRLHDLQRAVRADEFRVHASVAPLIQEVMAVSLAPAS